MVQGINYHLIVEAKFCRRGKVTNGKSQVQLDAVIQWAPYTMTGEESLVVTQVECINCLEGEAEPPEPEPNTPGASDTDKESPGGESKTNTLCGKPEAADGVPIMGECGAGPGVPNAKPWRRIPHCRAALLCDRAWVSPAVLAACLTLGKYASQHCIKWAWLLAHAAVCH